MLDELCAELRNYFIKSDKDKHYGKFTVNGGMFSPSLDYLQDGQYYRIVGSVFNDGVHQYPSPELIDETFDGAVWAMSVPPAVIELSEEIKAFVDSDAGKPSPYTSESFGGYSYSKATDVNGVAVSWQTVFAKRLNKWRRIHI